MKKIITIVLSILVFIWFGGFLIFSQRINSYPKDYTTKTEAIIVLTGGRNRIAEAVELFNKGLAKKMFISGVNKRISLNDIKDKQLLHINNETNVSIGQQAKNTIGNATETSKWLKEHNIKSIRLVTSNYHIDRSVIEFHEQSPTIKIIPHPVYSQHVVKKWWMSWHSFSLIFKEYNKLLYTYLRCVFF